MLRRVGRGGANDSRVCVCVCEPHFVSSPLTDAATTKINVLILDSASASSCQLCFCLTSFFSKTHGCTVKRARVKGAPQARSASQNNRITIEVLCAATGLGLLMSTSEDGAVTQTAGQLNDGLRARPAPPHAACMVIRFSDVLRATQIRCA